MQLTVTVHRTVDVDESGDLWFGTKQQVAVRLYRRVRMQRSAVVPVVVALEREHADAVNVFESVSTVLIDYVVTSFLMFVNTSKSRGSTSYSSMI